MGLGQININDELLSRTRTLVNAASYLTLRNHMLAAQPLTPVVEGIDLLLTQEYERDKKNLLQKQWENAFVMQSAQDAKEAQEDLNEDLNDQTRAHSYQQEITNLHSRRAILENDISHLQHELTRLQVQITQLNNAYTMPTVPLYVHEQSYNHTHEHANIHVHVHHPHHHHAHDGSLNNLHLWSQIQGLQSEYSSQTDRLKTLESNLNKLNTRLAELDGLNRELPKRLNRRNMRQQERAHRASIRQHNSNSLDQLSRQSKDNLDKEIKHQTHLLDGQLQGLRLELSRQSYPCFLQVLDNNIHSGALSQLEVGEQEQLKMMLNRMQEYYSKKMESETITQNITMQTSQLTRAKSLLADNAKRIQANNNTVTDLQRNYDLGTQDDQRLHHRFAVTTRKKNTALYCSLGTGLGAVASFYATIFFTMNPIFFLIPGIMVLLAVTSLITGAVYQAKKSALQEDIADNAKKMTSGKLEVSKLTKKSQELSGNNLQIQREIYELEQQISSAKMKLSTVEISMGNLLQEAKAMGEECHTAMTPFIFFRPETTPSAPSLTQSTSHVSDGVTPF